MKSVGIIAEYNPFHNGHAYQLQKAKEASGADFAVAVMSGDFVQRGEPAMFEKRLRAKWALENGADMVITLPTPFALASAEAFALGGVTLLSRSGIVDSIAFGSECGDTDLLCRAADVLNNEPDELKALIRSNISRGLSYPDARARAFDEYLPPELASVLSSPNDILGIEYIRAIRRIHAALQPIAIGRTGVAHDSAHTCGGFTSASNIRRLIVSGESEHIKSYIPKGIYEDMLSVLGRTAPITLQSLSRETVYALRRMSKEQLKSLPDVTEGLENLLYSACRKYSDIGSVLTAVKSRRYTMARLKRICMCALLGIYGSPMKKLDSLFIRVLGIRREAQSLLSALHEKSELPVFTRYGDVSKLNERQSELMALEVRCADIAALGRPSLSPVKSDFSYPLIIV